MIINNKNDKFNGLTDIGDEYKTIDYISRGSIETVHKALRSISGESPESFEIRFRILHSIATKAPNPQLKLEAISSITGLPNQVISPHLQPLREGGLIDNKGGQSWYLKAKGRRLLDNLTILLFEHSGDFDEIDLIRASLTHLNELSKEYKLNLNVNSRILRFFDYILGELEDLAIELLTPIVANKIRQTLKKARPFYEFLKSAILNDSNIVTQDAWTILDRLANRHIIVGKVMNRLNQHINKLGANLDIQEVLDQFMMNLTAEQAVRTCEGFSRFTIYNVYPKIATDNVIAQARKILSQEKPPEPPNFSMLEIQEPSEGVMDNDYIEARDVLMEEIKARLKKSSVWILDLIDPNNWEKSVVTLILLARLSYEGLIEFKKERDENLNDLEITHIRNAEVNLIARSRSD